MILPLAGVLESTSKYSSHMNNNLQLGRNQGYQVVGKKTDVDDAKVDKSVDDQNMESSTAKTEDKPCSSEARPKEGIFKCLFLILQEHCLFVLFG